MSAQAFHPVLEPGQPHSAVLGSRLARGGEARAPVPHPKLQVVTLDVQRDLLLDAAAVAPGIGQALLRNAEDAGLDRRRKLGRGADARGEGDGGAGPFGVAVGQALQQLGQRALFDVGKR